MSDLPPEMLDSQTPAEVLVTDVAPPRITDPTLGVPLGPPPVGAAPIPANPTNPLVTVGDSLTHGLSSGAVFHVGLSWPAQVARALGTTTFTAPSYGGPLDGLPLNIEKVARRLQDRFGKGMSWWEKLETPKELQDIFDENEDYWERGPGSAPPAIDVRYQNLGIYGWDLRDALSYTAARAAALAGTNADDSMVGVKPDHDNDIAASSVLAPFGPDATQLSAAAWHGRNGGIDTLVVALGANNALDPVVSKRVSWSDDGFDRLDAKAAYNVWKPSHFAAEYALVVGAVKAIAARRVILTTVPHVTIAPLARGVNPANPGKKWQPGSRFFPYYADPWIDETSFRPSKHRHLTHQQARAIDSAIDQYNTTITTAVRQARTEGRDWYVMDLCGLLDSLAYRRFDDDPLAATAQRLGALRPAEADRDARHPVLPVEQGRPDPGWAVRARRHPPHHHGLRHRGPGDPRRPRRLGSLTAHHRLRRPPATGLAQLAASRPGPGHARDPRPVRDGPGEPPQRGVAQRSS